MSANRAWTSVAFMFVAAFPVAAIDLEKIDRTIGKEPAYQTKEPQYCLLVFGPEARTRVWLVLDGDTLFVDRNGDGDLTEKGESVEGVKSPAGDDGIRRREFMVGDILEADGKTKHTDFQVSRYGIYTYLAVKTNGTIKQTAGYDGQGGQLLTAKSPKEAPIVHFNGPRTLAISGMGPALIRGEKAIDFKIAVSTPGLGKGTRASYSNLCAPKDLHPQVELKFVNRDPGGKPLIVKASLNQRC